MLPVQSTNQYRITSYNVCYTKLLRVVVREKVKNAKGDYIKEIVVENETGQQAVNFVTKDVKSTKTTIPFIKNHEFDYKWIVNFMGESSEWVRWIVYRNNFV